MQPLFTRNQPGSSPSHVSSPIGVPDLLTVLALVMLLSACSKDVGGTLKGEDSKKKAAVPVTIGTAIEKTVPVQLKGIGNVYPYSTVSVKAQAEGQLTGVHFKEGQEVKAGDLLFTIDARLYEAQLKEAEANLAKNKALLQNARKRVERYASVVSKGYVAEEQYDQVVSTAASLEAGIKADEATIENARLKVGYCTIRSPVTGVVGSLRVHKGNLIKSNDNDRPLVIINQIRPVYVAFSVPERNLAEIRRHMSSRTLEVLASIPGDPGEPAKGELAFIENTVDTNTGSIQLKAAFPNEDKRLWPGQFVSIVLTLTTQAGAVVVPSQAIQTGQHGQYAFVLKGDQTVEYRPVTVGQSLESETVIIEGIRPGEKVVTDGQLRLASGSAVKIADQESAQSREEDTP